jgi:hypothetical protein
MDESSRGSLLVVPWFISTWLVIFAVVLGYLVFTTDLY